MNEIELPASGESSPPPEIPDRASPRLQTIYGDALTTDSVPATTRVTRQIEIDARRAIADDIEHEDETPNPAPKADESLANERTQQMLRVQEFAHERHLTQQWDGSEHVGTVVSSSVDGLVMHVGRHEYIHVPQAQNERGDQLIGRYISVDRTGSIRESHTNAHEPAGLERRSHERDAR